MKQYLYPQNLTAKPLLWFWQMKDFLILCLCGLGAVLALVLLGWTIPLAITLMFAVLTIRKDDISTIDYIKYAVRYFVFAQQRYEWR